MDKFRTVLELLDKAQKNLKEIQTLSLNDVILNGDLSQISITIKNPKEDDYEKFDVNKYFIAEKLEIIITNLINGNNNDPCAWSYDFDLNHLQGDIEISMTCTDELS